MKLQIKTTFSFSKLAKYVSSESFREQSNKLLGQGIIESSRDFMKSGRVTAPLKESTVKIRKIRGSSGDTPLYDTGALAKSLKVAKEGIKGLHYGKYQYEGFNPTMMPIIKNDRVIFTKNTKGIKVPARNFIAMDTKRMAKPINALMKKIGKALKK